MKQNKKSWEAQEIQFIEIRQQNHKQHRFQHLVHPEMNSFALSEMNSDGFYKHKLHKNVSRYSGEVW